MMKHLLLLVTFLVVFTGKTNAQTLENRVLKVGDYVKIGKCTGNSFQFIDFHRKTRFSPTPTHYDTSSGVGFYQSFFLDGDYDAYRLPCSYSGKLYRIISLELFTDKKTGSDRRVIFLQLDKPNEIAWIELDKALDSGEIIIE